MQSAPFENDDIAIEIRKFILNLWKSRLLFIILPVSLGLIVFVITHWFIKPQYQATAYVYLGQPALSYTQSTGLNLSQNLPDIKAVEKLATVPEILDQVLKVPELVQISQNQNINIVSLAKNIDVSDIGKDQIKISVIDANPDRAAILANSIANVLAEKINKSYGWGSLASGLSDEADQDKKHLDEAQTALEKELAQNNFDSLVAVRDAKIAELNNTLQIIDLTNKAIDDLAFLEQGILNKPNESVLSYGDWFALISIRQNIISSSSRTQVNFNQLQPDSAAYTGLKVSDARQAIIDMRTSLNSSLNNLQTKQAILEKDIPDLQTNIAAAQASINRVTLNRDIALNIYNDVILKQQQIENVLKKNAMISYLSTKALPPQSPISPNVLLYTIEAAFIGLLFTILIVIIKGWWLSTGKAESH